MYDHLRSSQIEHLFVLADSYIYRLCATLSEYNSDVNHLYRKHVQRDCDLVTSERYLYVIWTAPQLSCIGKASSQSLRSFCGNAERGNLLDRSQIRVPILSNYSDKSCEVSH